LARLLDHCGRGTISLPLVSDACARLRVAACRYPENAAAVRNWAIFEPSRIWIRSEYIPSLLTSAVLIHTLVLLEGPPAPRPLCGPEAVDHQLRSPACVTKSHTVILLLGRSPFLLTGPIHVPHNKNVTSCAKNHPKNVSTSFLGSRLRRPLPAMRRHVGSSGSRARRRSANTMYLHVWAESLWAQ
jgi:hypothetical protein